MGKVRCGKKRYGDQAEIMWGACHNDEFRENGREKVFRGQTGDLVWQSGSRQLPCRDALKRPLTRSNRFYAGDLNRVKIYPGGVTKTRPAI
jgi:hypothetical protein